MIRCLKPTRFVVALLLAASPSSVPVVLSAEPAVAERPAMRPAADQALRGAIAAKQFAGVTAGISRGETIHWTGSAGLCDVETKTACTPETLMRIASITKPMTAVAILQLKQQGLIDLDQPIATYLPDYPAEMASRITTRQLLYQTSGIDGYGSSKETESRKQYSTLAEAAAVFQDRKLLFEPGSAFSYTTYGYVVLGMIVENVSGKSYEQYLRENIWKPASMSDTGVEEFGKRYENKSSLYVRSNRGRIREGKANNLSNRVPGGGVYSTAEDLLRFGRALLDGTLLSPESFASMLEHPQVDRGKNNPYGYGFFIYAKDPKHGLIVGHPGEQTGAAGQLMILPQADTVVIVLSNTGRAGRQASELSVTLMRQVLAD